MLMTKTLKEVLHELVEGSEIKLKVLAELLGISYSYLANAVNPDLPRFEFQLRHLIPLTNITKDYRVLDHIEAACGRVAIPLPDSVGDPEKVSIELCHSIKEFGDIAKVTGQAIKNGKISKKEAKNIETETMETVAQLMKFLAVVQGAANG